MNFFVKERKADNCRWPELFAVPVSVYIVRDGSTELTAEDGLEVLTKIR